MGSAPTPSRRLPRWLHVGLFLVVAAVLAVDMWFNAAAGRPVLRSPTVVLVLALILLPLVPHVRKLGVGSMSLAFRKPSRDLQDELVRSAAALLGDGSASRDAVARLRRVDDDPDGAVAAAVELVYRSLYELLTVLEERCECSTAELPEPSADGPPPREAVRTALDRVAEADTPEVERLTGVLDGFLDALLAARESSGVTAGEARELVELGAHLVTYLRLYARLYDETDGRPARSAASPAATVSG